jgi:virginiamycin B lyase
MRNHTWRQCAAPGRSTVEALEPRHLLTIEVGSFALPTAGSMPYGIVTGSDGILWFTESHANQLGEVDTKQVARFAALSPSSLITEIPIPVAGGSPQGITIGPGGTVWFTELKVNQVDEYDPASGMFHEFTVPTENSFPYWITEGPDNNLWFTEYQTNKIGAINPATGMFHEFTIPTAASGPQWITPGPDGNLWFVEARAGKIGTINPASGAISDVAIPTPASDPSQIITGPDGNLWFTEFGGNKIGMINPTTKTFNEFAIPTADSNPVGIATAPDGYLFFTESENHLGTGNLTPPQANTLGEINVTTGAITEVPVPSTGSVTPNLQPWEVTLAPDGSIWATEFQGGLVNAFKTGTFPTVSSSAPTADVGQPVTFTAVVSPLEIVTIPQGGSVVFTIDGLPQPPVAVSVVNGQDQATFTTSALTAGTHTITATYTGGPMDAASVRSNPLTETIVVPDGPLVTGLQRVTKRGVTKSLVLTFSERLNPSLAQEPAEYQVLTVVGHHKGVPRLGRPNHVTSAVAVGPVVTIKLRNAIAAGTQYQLTVTGAPPGGLTDTAGRFLDGQKTGTQGSNYTTFFSIKTVPKL